MCGIAGFHALGGGREADMRAAAAGMAAELQHRGPDGGGVWSDPAPGVALAFRRLAILDLTSAAAQPMVSASGRYVIVFNGEVYNFRALRNQLEGLVTGGFRGHGDTEVVLAAIERWGLLPALGAFVGMFAFALWDRELRRLHLVRDRLGVKPLYHGHCGRTLLFGSELDALRAYPGFTPQLDLQSARGMVQRGWVAGTPSIFAGVERLAPATILTCDGDSGAVETTRYWSLGDAMAQRREADWSDEAAEYVVHRVLADAVALRLESDVPLGVLLSGGVDSSLVAALASRASSGSIRTFNVGFDAPGYDEASHAAAVARHLGCEHTTMRVAAADALATVAELPHVYDEPAADPAAIPTLLLSRLTRRQVVVALSGDGGDELFAGYHRHRLGPRVWRAGRWLPRPLRHGLRAGARSVPARLWNLCGRLAIEGHRDLARRVDQLGAAMVAEGPDELYTQLTSHWPGSVRGTDRDGAWHGALADRPVAEQLMALDTLAYLPDSVLTKVDRASMAASLEAREPLLDHRLVELAWRLPLHQKLRAGKGKWILRRILRHYLPAELVDGGKRGFDVPLAAWLRGPLRAWAEDLLSDARAVTSGCVDGPTLARCWNEHLALRRDWHRALWNVLMLESWLRVSQRWQPAGDASSTARAVGRAG